jgi:hypothetical protein
MVCPNPTCEIPEDPFRGGGGERELGGARVATAVALDNVQVLVREVRGLSTVIRVNVIGRSLRGWCEPEECVLSV